MIKPPIAERKLLEIEIYGNNIKDYYAWLRDSNWPNVDHQQVLKYIEDENSYFEAVMHDQEQLIEELFLEMKSRIKEEDMTVPYWYGGYYYYSYVNSGQQYWVHARKYQSLKAEENILLDENVLAAGQQYMKVGEIKISPDHKLIAYTIDLKGDERYQVYVKNLENNLILDSEVEDITGSIEWDNNNKGFFYTPAGENWRANKVYYHALGTKKEIDQIIYKEDDIIFRVSLDKSESKQYLFIYSESSTSKEVYFLDLYSSEIIPTLIVKRREGHLYNVSHHGQFFYILTNNAGSNYRVVRVLINSLAEKYWQEVIPHSQQVYLVKIYLYKEHLVILQRVNGLSDILIINLINNNSSKIKFPDEAYYVGIIWTENFEAEGIRYIYSSLKTPNSIIEYNFLTNKDEVLKIQDIPSGFDSDKYNVERIWAESEDGTKVPISLLYNKTLFKKDGTNPLYLYGYGSYGIAVQPKFTSNIISLVDRGFVYAIAHIRGGDDLGYDWYESAKFLNKKRSFIDFIQAAQCLIEQQYTSKGKIVIAGGSAGGMLIGYCINECPELYKVAVAHVPFVDVLNTMLDITLPLTPGEFKEWGNPENKEYFNYIKSYSPYENVKQQNYPNIFVTAGLTDPRVGYWEPAKWVAKLRYAKTDENLLLFKTNTKAGHAGGTARFEYIKEKALEYAFILRCLE